MTAIASSIKDDLRQFSSMLIGATEKLHKAALIATPAYLAYLIPEYASSTNFDSAAPEFFLGSIVAGLVANGISEMGPYELLNKYISKDPIKMIDDAEKKRKIVKFHNKHSPDEQSLEPAHYLIKASKHMSTSQLADLYSLLELKETIAKEGHWHSAGERYGMTGGTLNKYNFSGSLKKQVLMVLHDSNSVNEKTRDRWNKAIRLSEESFHPQRVINEDYISEGKGRSKKEIKRTLTGKEFPREIRKPLSDPAKHKAEKMVDRAEKLFPYVPSDVYRITRNYLDTSSKIPALKLYADLVRCEDKDVVDAAVQTLIENNPYNELRESLKCSFLEIMEEGGIDPNVSSSIEKALSMESFSEAVTNNNSGAVNELQKRILRERAISFDSDGVSPK